MISIEKTPAGRRKERGWQGWRRGEHRGGLWDSPEERGPGLLASPALRIPPNPLPEKSGRVSSLRVSPGGICACLKFNQRGSGSFRFSDTFVYN